MSTTTPLTDRINALLTYSNEITGQNDTTLSDAVAHLTAGYGGGESPILPAEYKQVEYIQSSGTQYIDTGVTGRVGLKIVCCMGWVTLSGALWGVRKNSGDYRYFITIYNGIDFAFIEDHASNISPVAGSIYTLTYDTSYLSGSNLLFVREVLEENYLSFNSGSSTFNAEASIYIFGYNRPYASGPLLSSTIFKSMRITDHDGNILFNGIPCYRISDGVIGIYDFANSTFLTNQGTGTFTKGADV